MMFVHLTPKQGLALAASTGDRLPVEQGDVRVMSMHWAARVRALHVAPQLLG